MTTIVRKKTISLEINATDVIAMIEYASEDDLTKIVGELKARNETLYKTNEKGLNRKHYKKIAKGYLHCPKHNAIDEIAKSRLQELIYELGVDEVVNRLTLA